MDQREDGPLPRLADVLRLPELSQGQPLIVAGHDAFDRRVRWVHVSELSDIATHLQGGELILTTGIALPTDAPQLEQYIDELSEAAACGLVIELGRRFQDLPEALIERANRCGLPLVALQHEVAFVRVTEEVHRLIVDAHIDELRASEQAHTTFTEMSIEGAPPDAIVDRLVEMSGRPVVLENLTHQVVSFAAAGMDADDLLHQWERRSRMMASSERTMLVSEHPPWIATQVAAQGERWGRLLIQAEPAIHHRMLLEQAATAIALNRLVDRDRGTLERNAHRSLLAKIADRSYSSTAEVITRAKALGVPLGERFLVAAYIRVDRRVAADGIETHARQRDDAERVAHVSRALGMPVLVSLFEPDGIGLLVPFVAQADIEPGMEDLVLAVHHSITKADPGSRPKVAVSSPVKEIADVRRALREAVHVSQAISISGQDKLYYQIKDVRVRGLLHMMRDDIRLQSFVEHELGPLLAHDERGQTALIDVLAAFLDNSGNKSAGAAAAHLSRPAFYQRLDRISKILAADLESAEVRLSLHLAVTALEVLRGVAEEPHP